MNYISEIRAFYDWVEYQDVSTNEIVLWHALMSICNKTHWQDSFTVAISTLNLKTRLSRQAIYKARNKLRQLNRIDFKERRGNQSTVYQIIPFVSTTETQSDTQMDTQSNTQLYTQMDTQGLHINKHKQDETKQKEIAGTAGSKFKLVMEDYERYINAAPSAAVYHDLKSYVDDGIEPELIQQAIYKANDEGVRKISYIKGILNICLANGLKTKEAFLLDTQSWDSRKKEQKTEPDYSEVWNESD